MASVANDRHKFFPKSGLSGMSSDAMCSGSWASMVKSGRANGIVGGNVNDHRMVNTSEKGKINSSDFSMPCKNKIDSYLVSSDLVLRREEKREKVSYHTNAHDNSVDSVLDLSMLNRMQGGNSNTTGIRAGIGSLGISLDFEHDHSLEKDTLLTDIDFELSKGETLGTFPCIRLSGLDYATTINDILSFFDGLGPVLDVIIMQNHCNDGVLQALVLFGNLMDYQGALQRYSLQLAGRYVDISPAFRPDFYAAIMERKCQPVTKFYNSIHSPCTPSVSSMKKYSNSCVFSIPHSSISPLPTVATTSQPNLTELKTPEMRRKSSTNSVRSGKSCRSHTYSTELEGCIDEGNLNRDCSKDFVIRMRGLPYRASKFEVINFFQGISVTNVNFVVRSDGRVTGEAFAQFSKIEDLRAGMQRDRQIIGNRYIELFSSSMEEMSKYVRHCS